MGKERFFTFGTLKGCKRLLALMLSLILLSSFIGHMLSTDNGKVKMSEVSIDSRGAVINGDLYYPAGTSDRDSLPAIITAHGGGVERGVARGFAEELARRGFVVLNIDAYCVAGSEMPVSDDGGQGIDGFDNKITPSGVYDALEYLRTLHFVDKTRIGLTGHSMGSRRTGHTCYLDCGYFTKNDLLINILYDHFGQTFTEAEINQDADELAAARLNVDQLAHYNELREEAIEYYNTRVKALCLVGSAAELVGLLQEVTVGGHQVMRNCQVNYGIVDGAFDFNYNDYITRDTTKEAWHTAGADAELSTWYALDDVNATSKTLGNIETASVLDSAELKEAVENRCVRMFTLNKETHSKNFFSAATTSDLVKFFEQTLGYNGGELGSADAAPIDAYNSVFMWSELFNLFAMLFMVGAVVCLAAVLLKGEFFAPCVAPLVSDGAKTVNKKKYWLFALLGIAVEFYAIYLANGVFVPGLPNIAWLPFFPSWWLTFIFIGVLSLGAVLTLGIQYATDRKNFSLKALNIRMNFVKILKTVLLGAILLAFAYFTLVLVLDLFNEDYRFWMAVFGEMKIEYWRFVWRFTLCMVPFFLFIGASTNYTIREDMPEWKDTLITIVVNSLGVYLCCIVNWMMLVGKNVLWSTFISTYGILIIVPITVYITRKMYKLTNSIWLGAITNAFLVAWSFCSSMGLNCMVYHPQTWISNFFNI